MKIILWGYPLYSHTYSYIHEAFYRAFKHMGYDVYWFHDDEYPKDFDWNNCIFLTEGFADKNIPLNSSSVYFVHGTKDPAKYINGNVKNYIDVRYSHLWHKDHIYEYTLNKNNVTKVGQSCYYQPKETKTIHFKNDYVNYNIPDYNKFYITWATNKLPHEINFDDVNYSRKNVINFCGNLSGSGRCENYSTFVPFINECSKNNIPFIHNDPFRNPLSEEEVVKRTKDSIISIDIRGPEHLKNGYVPCRVFKSISAGHLGTTNSQEVYNELNGHCLYEPNTANLFYRAMEKKNDKEFILNSMKYVKEHHTYINRINSLLSLL